MKSGRKSRQGRRQPAILAVLLLTQSIAAVFFIGDAVTDLLAAPDTAHSIVEAFVAIALILGIITGGWQLRLSLEKLQEQEKVLAAARGQFARLIEAQFEAWGLTKAERDVGKLALKGLDIAEIAGIRNAAQGTVRAQLTHIYAKAGVSGRAQFASSFVEDLLNETLVACGKDA